MGVPITSAADDFNVQASHLMAQVDDLAVTSFQKVLYLVMVEALGKIRFPEVKGNGERFVRLVREFGQWAHRDRVSLPQAQLLLQREPTIGPEVLAFVRKRLAAWDLGPHDISEDPMPGDFPVSGLPEPLRRCQHVELLWAFRNTLVHEFRHPSWSNEELHHLDAQTPVYLHLQVGNNAPAWELIMPTPFLAKLARNCLVRAVDWIRETGTDPWASFYDGPIWIQKYQ